MTRRRNSRGAQLRVKASTQKRGGGASSIVANITLEICQTEGIAAKRSAKVATVGRQRVHSPQWKHLEHPPPRIRHQHRAQHPSVIQQLGFIHHFRLVQTCDDTWPPTETSPQRRRSGESHRLIAGAAKSPRPHRQLFFKASSCLYIPSETPVIL